MSLVKKLLVLLLSITVILLSSCNKFNDTNNLASQKTNINIAFLKGPTGLGALKLIDDSKNDKTENNYNISVLTDSNQIVAKVASGEVDIAALPTNLASSLYNKSSADIEILAINTLGVLYIVSDKSENINSISDLKGKTLYATGQGAVPEYILNFILSNNSIDPQNDVNIEYKSEHSELASLVISGQSKVAMLPEPFVTQIESKNSNISKSIDLTNEWEKSVNDGSSLTMGCLVVKREFANNNKEAVNKFLNEYRESVNYTNDDIDGASELAEKYDIMTKNIAKDAIPSCNIVYIDGDDMKLKTDGFLNVLFKFNPKSIGGKIPGEDFYYKK